ncbi:hypothetical protein [Actinospica robiniae]|uniref:hypothetical protein n=1 Tax=Actinospica robiniae TaxID=304901 RepID=UPI0004224726|nr:hypothetical protein [Actinospica robiniae]
MTEQGRLDLILATVAETADCEVMPLTSETFQPAREEVEPADLHELRRSSGGLRLHASGGHPWTVTSTPVPAGPVLLSAAVADQVRAESPDDLTNTCHVIATDKPGTSTGFNIVIDLHHTRAGRCYLTAWDSFGIVGDMPIVAHGVTGLLDWLLSLGGANPAERLPNLGDAYDDWQRSSAASVSRGHSVGQPGSIT